MKFSVTLAIRKEVSTNKQKPSSVADVVKIGGDVFCSMLKGVVPDLENTFYRLFQFLIHCIPAFVFEIVHEEERTVLFFILHPGETSK